MRLGIATSLLLGAVSTQARADVYTRISVNGVVEATNRPDGGNYRLAYRSKGTLIHSSGFKLRASNNRVYDEHILAAAATHGVSIDLVRAVIQVESQFDRFATSTAGAQGLMQLMPFTAQRFGVTDSFDARQNIFAGTRYLRLLLDQFRGDVALATAGFNAGENAVVRYRGIPPYRETQNYVRKIQAILGNPPAASLAATAVAAPAVAPATPAAFYTPMSAGTAKAGSGRTYYRWQDDNGRTHIAQSPPSDRSYTTIR